MQLWPAQTEELDGADRLSAEARHQPRQVARPVRAAAAGGVAGSACRARRSGSPTARRSTSGAASAATASKGDGNGPAATFMYKHRPRNFTLGVFKFRHDSRAAARPTATCCARSRAACAARRCRPGTSCRTKDRLAVIQYIKYELAVDRSRSRTRLTPTSSRSRRAAALHRRRRPSRRRRMLDARQGSLDARPSAGSATARRQGRRREGGRAQGRLRVPDPPGRSHHRPVQVGAGRGGHLPHHAHRPVRHADAVLSAIRCRRRTAGRWPTTCCRCRRSRIR